MATFETERDLLRAVRERLDGWIYGARAEAFEGSDAVLSGEELHLFDRIDSRLSRERGQGLWSADEYAVVATGTPDEESTPRVVCTNHPDVPAEAYPGPESFPATSRSTLDDARWEYSQRVVEGAQKRLEAFVLSADVGPREE